MENGDNSQEDPAPILNALQMLQFGLKLNRKAETAVSEEPENSIEAPIKDKKAKKKEKKEKERKAKEDKKERDKLMELFEDEKRLVEMFESPKKSKSKSKEPPKEKERRSEKGPERDGDVDESKFKFKLKDSKKLRSLTPEQEEYLLKLSKEVDEERKKKEHEEEKQKEEKEEEDEKRADEERKKEEEEAKGQIVHRQLVKTAECQEHERIIRRIEDAPKQGKEEETEPEEGEVCSSAMPSDEEKEEEDERQERLEAVADAKSKLDLIRSELERVRDRRLWRDHQWMRVLHNPIGRSS